MIKINLIGVKGQRSKEKKINVSSIEFSPKIALIIAIFLVEFVALGVATYMLNRKLNRVESKYRSLSRLEVKVRSIKAKIGEVNRMVRAIKKLEKNRGEASRILEEIADAMPNISYGDNNASVSLGSGNLWFTKVSKRKNKIFIDGMSFSAEAVADYMMRLEALKNVAKVRFNGSGLRKVSENNGTDVYSFSIIVTLKG